MALYRGFIDLSQKHQIFNWPWFIFRFWFLFMFI